MTHRLLGQQDILSLKLDGVFQVRLILSRFVFQIHSVITCMFKASKPAKVPAD